MQWCPVILPGPCDSMMRMILHDLAVWNQRLLRLSGLVELRPMNHEARLACPSCESAELTRILRSETLKLRC